MGKYTGTHQVQAVPVLGQYKLLAGFLSCCPDPLLLPARLASSHARGNRPMSELCKDPTVLRLGSYLSSHRPNEYRQYALSGRWVCYPPSMWRRVGLERRGHIAAFCDQETFPFPHESRRKVRLRSLHHCQR